MQQEDKTSIFQMRFPQKLWYMLNMQTDAILWGGTGRTILLNYRILHTYLQSQHSIFKTANISSFVRQLNLYGFRKVTSHLQDPLCNSCNPYMHEYVHDYFEYGRPELLNKITRKALALKKSYKTKDIYNNSDQLQYLTPLEKARRNLKEALKRASNDIYMQSSPQEFFSLNYDSEDTPNENNSQCNNDEIMFDWVLNKDLDVSIEKELPAATKAKFKKKKKGAELNCLNNEDFGDNQEVNPMSYKDSNDHLMNYKDSNDHPMSYKDTNDQMNDHFPTQFLSMPDLDPEPRQESSGVELLAEFNIDHDPDSNIVKELNINKENDHVSLNCVLPSINCDPIDDVTMTDKDNNLDQYNGEWDQMFKDIMTSKINAQECGSELKELYSQISRTINLLND